MAEWQATMTQVEFQRWMGFYETEPFDDLHRFHRPAALIATSMSGGKVDDRLEWLQPSRIETEYSGADMATFAAFGIKPPNR